MAEDWAPTATRERLVQRARLISEVRTFFAEREVLEVETPVLGQAGSTDVGLASLSLTAQLPGERERVPLWLQTSPEFHMKRLLAAGSGPIFQIARAFRDGEVSRRHNPEFCMLEWYRPGMCLEALMTETCELIRRVMALGAQLTGKPSLLSESQDAQIGPAITPYRALFRRVLALDPFTASLEELRAACARECEVAADDWSHETCLDALMSLVIEPTLGSGSQGAGAQGRGAQGIEAQGKATVELVTEYPAAQAALARKHQDSEGDWVASRFEAYVAGIELANGYDELTDASEQAARFAEDNAARVAQGLPEVAADQRLVAALQAGMPAGSGVALGLDRLIMLALGERDISAVIAFPASRA
ncbi:EF-P lysine aminoacylase GenX [Cobetia sp. 29-18-1]|uniref:EF-P lysine aminoacylase GenX n=1 Tax=Cobetia sp. 29-18-1 TaxID=3040018 RepID=UPI00244976A4|nr:EF-P lysine aminoacylase GenX [Cobetia sp. 29-18-1]MDH2298757.1 EF-P lysine aminoacylase GenX [Cobetia sp. 29-18-1]